MAISASVKKVITPKALSYSPYGEILNFNLHITQFHQIKNGLATFILGQSNLEKWEGGFGLFRDHLAAAVNYIAYCFKIALNFFGGDESLITTL
ncbi:hypothetical protein TNCV_5050301 [Trichonephila clavipes]|nr:hypothetical protein TNCV_5050301 [Trichonephila clavipes]